MKKIIVLILLFGILGGLYYYKIFIVKNNFDAQRPIDEEEKSLIAINNQRPGNFVFINSVSLDDGGYIVIQGSVGSNKNLEIIGNSKILPVGESNDILVRLIRPTQHGEKLFAVIYKDSGDGLFYPSIDIPVEDSNGDIVFIEFYVDVNAPKIDVAIP